MARSRAIWTRVMGPIWVSGSKPQWPTRTACCWAFNAGSGNRLSRLASAMAARKLGRGRFAPTTGTPARTAAITAGP